MTLPIFNQWTWPDSKSFLEQEFILTQVFQIIKSELERNMAVKIKQKLR